MTAPKMMRFFVALIAMIMAMGSGHADTPLGIEVTFFGVERGILHAPADTSQPFYVDGQITDPSGEPLAGITVTDGTQSTATDEFGSWSLPEPTSGQYVVTMKSDLTDTAAYRLSPGVPNVYGAVVSLAYNVGVSAWTVDGAAATVTVNTTAPSIGTCVRVVDADSGSVTNATNAGAVDAGGASLWQAAIDSTVTRIRVAALRCSDNRALTDTRSVSYPIERATGPAEGAIYWFDTQNPVIAFGVSDSGSGVDYESISVVVDGRALAVGPWVIPNFEAQARGLSDGLHSATVTVSDRTGNTATIPITIGVDTSDPQLASLSPAEGTTITDKSPVFSVLVSETGGINPLACRFVLTNGVVSSTLRPWSDGSYVVYEVPENGSSPYLGRGPLPPGFYTVDAYVQDRAGNESHVSSFFTVLP